MKRISLIFFCLIFAVLPYVAAEEIAVDPNLIVVMTDIHQGTTLPAGRKPIPENQRDKEKRLHTACEKIAAMNPRPAHVLILGDVAYLDGAVADYQKAAESLDLLDAANIPWTATLGNHDRIENFLTVFPEKKLETEPVPGKLVRTVETPACDFLLIDTHQESAAPIEKENPGDGALIDAERAWLAEKIAGYNESKKPFYVASHHPWFEKNVNLGPALKGAESFVAYLFGHWHWQTNRTTDDGISGTCFSAVAYAFGDQPLGFTRLQTAPDGKSATLTIVALDENDPRHGNVRNLPANEFITVASDGGNGAYEAFPDVCRLNDGRLLCAFYDGWTHISLPNAEHPNGGRITGVYSNDEGKTWSEPIVLIDTPLDDRDPSLVSLDDGRLLCNWFTYEPVANGKAAQCRLMLAESSDEGQTWSEPKMIFENVPTSSPIRKISDNRLILPTYVETDTEHSGSIAYSDDNGKTWSDNIVIPNGGMKLDAETDVIQRKDGSLYALQRDKMAYSVSTDRGQTWSESKDVGFAGHCPYLLRTSGDVIVTAFRIPNTSLRFSRDECATWSGSFLVDTVGGAYPSMVELADHSILIVYYEEGDGSNIRARRFRIHKDNTLEWLAPAVK